MKQTNENKIDAFKTILRNMNLDNLRYARHMTKDELDTVAEHHELSYADMRAAVLSVYNERTAAGQTAVYEIPEDNMEALFTKLNKLNKKAKRFGLPETTVKETGERFETRKKNREEYTIRFIEIEVNFGAIPVLDGWSFIARIDHDGVIGNTVAVVPGLFLPEQYRNAESNCEHCGHKRNRKRTYICEHTDGRFIQVGSTCLKDFIGKLSPDYVLTCASIYFDADGMINELREPREERATRYFNLRHFLAESVKVIKRDGWLSVSKARESYNEHAVPTVTYILNDLFPERGYTPDEPTADDWATADKVIDWAKTMDENNKSDYAFNCAKIARAGLLKSDHFALIASLVASYNRAMGKATERELAARIRETSTHYGEIKKRYDMTLTVLSVQEMPPTQWGVSYLVKFTDGTNLFSWFASDTPDMEVGETVSVRATVKAHREYKGVEETQLTRVQ